MKYDLDLNAVSVSAGVLAGGRSAGRRPLRLELARPVDHVDLRPLLLAAALLLLAGLLLRNSEWNRVAMLALHQGPDGAARHVFWSAFTVLGFGWAALIVCAALDRRRGEILVLLPAMLVLSAVVTQVAKRLTHVPRPAATPFVDQLHVIGQAMLGNNSLPSGHALAAGAAATLLCLWMPGRWVRRWGHLLAAAAILVAVSRAAVAAHWPADTVCGFALGVLGVLLLAFVRRWRGRAAVPLSRRLGLHRPRAQCVVAALELAAAAAFVGTRTGYPDGRWMVGLLAAVAVLSAAARVRKALARWRGAGGPAREARGLQ